MEKEGKSYVRTGPREMPPHTPAGAATANILHCCIIVVYFSGLDTTSIIFVVDVLFSFVLFFLFCCYLLLSFCL